jgi:hypothetical protein
MGNGRLSGLNPSKNSEMDYADQPHSVHKYVLRPVGTREHSLNGNIKAAAPRRLKLPSGAAASM